MPKRPLTVRILGPYGNEQPATVCRSVARHDIDMQTVQAPWAVISGRASAEWDHASTVRTREGLVDGNRVASHLRSGITPQRATEQSLAWPLKGLRRELNTTRSRFRDDGPPKRVTGLLVEPAAELFSVRARAHPGEEGLGLLGAHWPSRTRSIRMSSTWSPWPKLRTTGIPRVTRPNRV